MPRKPFEIEHDDRYISRRKWLSMLGVAGAAGIAGCGGDGNGTDTPGSADTPTNTEAMDQTQTQDFGDTATPTATDRPLPEVSGTYDTVSSAAYSTLNPLFNTESGAGTAIGYALDLGYSFTDQQEVFPQHYDLTTDDGQVWVFDIRENLQFSDPYGQVTAEDYVYQIQELHQNDTFPTADSSAWPADVNVTQNSEFEFQAELPSSNILWPRTFDPLLYPIPQDLVQPYVEEEDVEGLRQDTELLELQFTGNLGGYNLDEWNRGSGTSYSRSEDYYIRDVPNAPDSFAEAPYFEGVTTSVVQEQSARLGALETGEADVAVIPPTRFEEFRGKDSVEVYQIPQPYNVPLAVNMRDNGWNAGPGNLFRHTPFRQALAAAVSKNDLIEGVYRGLAKPHYTWQPEFSRWYPADADLPTYGTGDLYGASVAQDRAMQAFEMSDHDYSFDGDTMVNPDGDQVVLDLYHSAGQETERLTAEFVAQELGDNLGIDVTVSAIDGTRFDSQYWQGQSAEAGATDEAYGKTFTWERPSPTNPGPRSATSQQAWDMSLVYGLNTFPRNPLTNTAFFDGATGYYNPVGYYPEFDAAGLFEQARQATSIDELQSAFTEIFVNLAEEQPYVMLVFPDSLTGYNPDLVGPIENFSNGWNFPAWYFEE
jgi:peptide/nickel transport system substrate-binding protein